VSGFRQLADDTELLTLTIAHQGTSSNAKLAVFSYGESNMA
jgi:hypothetical protein